MYDAGTRTTTKEHEQMILTTHSDKEKIKDSDGKDIQDDDLSEDTKEDSTYDKYDQDSSISFENETKKAHQEEELEDWIEYIKRSARERS